MISNLKKTVYVIYFLSFITVIYLVFIAEPLGYCGEKNRFLRDKEFIENAVRHEKRNMEIEDSEKAIRAFYPTHPDCCKVKRNFERILGFYKIYTVEVELTYKVNEETFKKTGMPFYKKTLQFNHCGYLTNSFGEGLQSIPDK